MYSHADSTVTLPFGSGTQRASIPASWNVTELRTAVDTRRRSEFQVIDETLLQPISSLPIASFFTSSDNILILVSDKTRRCRTHVFLPVLLLALERAGVSDQQIRILFATGTHPPQTAAEQRMLLGDAVYERYAIFEHDARDAESCVHVGNTKYGTSISVNRHVAWADRVLATGTIVHHYFAGFGGGAKLFVPGIASYETAVENHQRTITADGQFHPGCADGKIEGNPVILDIMDAVRFMPPTWYFAALLDDQGQIVDGVCGDLLTAHAEGCLRVANRYQLPVREAVDLTIVSTGGFPKDINFIQSHKSLHHAHYVTREKGVIICLAECREGLGNEEVMRWFDIEDESEFREALLNAYAMNAHTVLAMKEKAQRFRIIFVSRLPDELVRRLGMTPAESLEDAVALAARNVPESARVLLLENGSLIVPKLENREELEGG
jgi:nickel-dependent lactate racemase